MNKVYDNYLETSTVGTEESAWKIEEIKVNCCQRNKNETIRSRFYYRI